ncbi:MAG TPA: MBL fold metallo-hydrolase [Gemmatimonadaceae bacterium]|nr:MBL fold metallo-hydrolase [Gemmatimonadaceae bacterium]
MKLWMLGSGSSGNAILIECDGSRILIDCGFGTRTLAGRLKTIDVAPESIDACFVTHEHTDHVKGAGAAAKKWGWGVYATRGTAKARELSETAVHAIRGGETVELSRLTVTATATPHDANESVGYVVESRSTGARTGLFYDIGHVSRAIADACAGLDMLVLESNHDDDMLRNGPYPRWLQMRIACATGHLSNADSGAFARETVTPGLQHLVLAHLSENCNTPEVALANMRGAVKRTAFTGTVTAAKQDYVVGPFVLGGRKRDAPIQYSLL